MEKEERSRHEQSATITTLKDAHILLRRLQQRKRELEDEKSILKSTKINSTFLERQSFKSSYWKSLLQEAKLMANDFHGQNVAKKQSRTLISKAAFLSLTFHRSSSNQKKMSDAVDSSFKTLSKVSRSDPNFLLTFLGKKRGRRHISPVAENAAGIIEFDSYYKVVELFNKGMSHSNGHMDTDEEDSEYIDNDSSKKKQEASDSQTEDSDAEDSDFENKLLSEENCLDAEFQIAENLGLGDEKASAFSIGNNSLTGSIDGKVNSAEVKKPSLNGSSSFSRYEIEPDSSVLQQRKEMQGVLLLSEMYSLLNGLVSDVERIHHFVVSDNFASLSFLHSLRSFLILFHKHKISPVIRFQGDRSLLEVIKFLRDTVTNRDNLVLILCSLSEKVVWKEKLLQFKAVSQKQISIVSSQCWVTGGRDENITFLLMDFEEAATNLTSLQRFNYSSGVVHLSPSRMNVVRLVSSLTFVSAPIYLSNDRQSADLSKNLVMLLFGKVLQNFADLVECAKEQDEVSESYWRLLQEWWDHSSHLTPKDEVSVPDGNEETDKLNPTNSSSTDYFSITQNICNKFSFTRDTHKSENSTRHAVNFKCNKLIVGGHSSQENAISRSISPIIKEILPVFRRKVPPVKFIEKSSNNGSSIFSSKEASSKVSVAQSKHTTSKELLPRNLSTGNSCNKELFPDAHDFRRMYTTHRDVVKTNILDLNLGTSMNQEPNELTKQTWDQGSITTDRILRALRLEKLRQQPIEDSLQNTVKVFLSLWVGSKFEFIQNNILVAPMSFNLFQGLDPLMQIFSCEVKGFEDTWGAGSCLWHFHDLKQRLHLVKQAATHKALSFFEYPLICKDINSIATDSLTELVILPEMLKNLEEIILPLVESGGPFKVLIVDQEENSITKWIPEMNPMFVIESISDMLLFSSSESSFGFANSPCFEQLIAQFGNLTVWNQALLQEALSKLTDIVFLNLSWTFTKSQGLAVKLSNFLTPSTNLGNDSEHQIAFHCFTTSGYSTPEELAEVVGTKLKQEISEQHNLVLPDGINLHNLTERFKKGWSSITPINVEATETKVDSFVPSSETTSVFPTTIAEHVHMVQRSLRFKKTTPVNESTTTATSASQKLIVTKDALKTTILDLKDSSIRLKTRNLQSKKPSTSNSALNVEKFQLKLFNANSASYLPRLKRRNRNYLSFSYNSMTRPSYAKVIKRAESYIADALTKETVKDRAKPNLIQEIKEGSGEQKRGLTDELDIAPSKRQRTQEETSLNVGSAKDNAQFMQNLNSSLKNVSSRLNHLKISLEAQDPKKPFRVDDTQSKIEERAKDVRPITILKRLVQQQLKNRRYKLHSANKARQYGQPPGVVPNPGV